jgi:hypothetical protein
MKKILVLLIGLTLLISSQAIAVQVDYVVTTNNPNSSMCGLIPPPEVKIFYADTDYEMVVYFALSDVVAGDTIQINWYWEGSLYSEGDLITYDESGSFCATSSYTIIGTSIAYKTGNWRVDGVYNGSKIFSTDFYLQGIPPPGLCTMEAILGNDKESLDTLRTFRDTVLTKTEKGKRLISMYYKYSPVTVKYLENNPMLKRTLSAKVKSLIPLISAMNKK